MKKPDEELEGLLAPIRGHTIQLPEGYTPPEGPGEHDEFTTVRRGSHRGRKFEIHTTYRILIDDVPLKVHTSVLDNGTVNTHIYPQYTFPSAVDLVYKIIDDSNLEFPEDELGSQ